MTDGTRILTLPRANPINAYTMGGLVRGAHAFPVDEKLEAVEAEAVGLGAQATRPRLTPPGLLEQLLRVPIRPRQGLQQRRHELNSR